MQRTIEAIRDLDIVSVLSNYVTLKKSGANYKAKSPFSDEKTASFMVSPAKNIFKDFSSGKGGDAISFIMEHEKVDFIEAVKIIARQHNITIEQKQWTPEEKQAYEHRESLKVVNEHALKFFTGQLKNNPNAEGYARNRMEDDMIEMFDIGYAPNSWDALKNELTKSGIKLDALLDARLLSERNKKTFDFFRGRLIFPIFDDYGKPIAFGARWIPTGNQAEDKKQPKYLNTPEYELYNKTATLYGYHLAKRAISDKDGTYLVEGYTDVIRMHQIGVCNTVASCGTAITIEHVKKLARLSKNFVLVTDGDDAGLRSAARAAEIIINCGYNCNILPLPTHDADGKELKTDPDSFFTSAEIFKEYKNDNLQDYIIYYANQLSHNIKNYPDRKAHAIDTIAKLIVKYDDKVRIDLYVDQLAKIISPKKLWTDKIKELLAEDSKEDKASRIPKDVKLSDVEKYGFYIDKNCYHFSKKGDIIQASNFILTPLFHVESITNAKRLFEIKNEFGYTRVIELHQRDLITLSRFKERIESLGNFIWFATEIELNRLKLYLYEKTKTCNEIEQLGWQKNGFYAWANGIFNGEFTPIDKFGIVTHKDKHYYIPALSSIYRQEEGLFTSERRFIRKPGSITLYDYTQLLADVFGNNAIIGICFTIATLFRDILFQKFTFFPILNLFGPKGAGKTELAVSLIQMFGPHSKGPNINSTSKPALADHVAQFCNAVAHIDEYKNNLDFEKIEFLKGLWDGTGRTRMNMDKDKKKETTPVDAGIVLSGQEMPTADIALFSRLIFLRFTKVEYNDEEKSLFNRLKEIEKKGLTHLTEEILQFRKQFIKNFDEQYMQVSADIHEKLKKKVIEDRIFKNWTVAIAAYASIREHIKIPFSYEKIISIVAKEIAIQNEETKKGNELSTFWSIVEYLASEGLIQEEVDFRFDYTDQVNFTDKSKVQWSDPRQVIYVQMARIIPLYRKHGLQMKENVLPAKTLEYYLQNDTSKFLGKAVQRFSVLVDGTKFIDEGSGGKVKSKSARCMVFDYDKLQSEVTLHRHTDNVLGDTGERNPDSEEEPF